MSEYSNSFDIRMTDRPLYLESEIDWVDSGTTPTLVHGDLYPANLLGAPDGRLTAIVDFRENPMRDVCTGLYDHTFSRF